MSGIESLSFSSSASSPVKRRKRGVRNTDQYKQIKIKKAKVHGEEHFNHVNQAVGPRKTGEKCKCSLKCFSALSTEMLGQMIDKMNGFNTKDEQDVFLQGLIDAKKPKNCKKRMSDSELEAKSKSKKHKFKSNIFEYHIECNDRQKVCRVAFQSLFGVTKKRVARLCSLKSHNIAPRDMRGRSAGCRSRAISAKHRRKIHLFIDSILAKKAAADLQNSES